MVEAGHLWPSRDEWRPACTILGGGIPAIHPSAWNRNSPKFAVASSPARAPLKASGRGYAGVLLPIGNIPWRIRCEELLRAVATCYGLDFREFLHCPTPFP